MLKKCISGNTKQVKGKEWKLPLLSNKEIKMEWVPAGTFTMGSPVGEPYRKQDEGPETNVILKKRLLAG